jgi:hypothetical protein
MITNVSGFFTTLQEWAGSEETSREVKEIAAA